ncbi:hypothetical protein BpHYR1_036631, partial [Brachionus plicatilis]
MEKENKKKNFLNFFKRESSIDHGTKGKYRKKDSDTGPVRNLPLRRIKEKKTPRENIYDEIASLDDSFENMSEIMPENSNSLNNSIQSGKKRFIVEKVEEINEYDTLENMDMDAFKTELKTTTSRVNFDIKEIPSAEFKTNLDPIKSSSLEDIKLKARGRSKSAFVPNVIRTISSEAHHPKRRGILDAITKNLETPNQLKERRSSVFVKEDIERRSSVFFKDDKQRRLSVYVKEENESISSVQTNDQSDLAKGIQEFQKKQMEENLKNEEEEKEPIKMAIGLSIIYGLILCITGIFVSLDSNAGNLGNYRLINTLFYSFLYITGIIGVIIVYFDYNKYINNLYELFESKNMNKPAEFKRKKSHTNKNEDIYANASTLGDLSQREGSIDFQNMHIENEGERNLIDFSQKGFSGYLVDRNQPFNLYLTVGIGAFCIATLLQCCIGMAEAIENFVFGKTNCYVETYEGIISFL